MLKLRFLPSYIYMIIGAVLVNALLISMGRAEMNTDADIDIQDILDGLNQRIDTIGRLSAIISSQTFNISAPEDLHNVATHTVVGSRVYEVFKKYDKLRVRRTVLDPQDNSIVKNVELFAWDGTRSRGYREEKDYSNCPSGGSIKNEKGAEFTSDTYLSAIGDRAFTFPVSFHQIIKDGDWKIIGRETIGSYECISIESVFGAHRDGALRIWISPTHGFAPVQMRFNLNITGMEPIVEEMTDVKLKQVDGVWFPIKSTFTVHNPNVSPLWQITELALDEVSIGVDIPNEEFVLKFPPGLEVLDCISRITYKVDKDGELQQMYFVREDLQGGVDLQENKLSDDLSPMKAPASYVVESIPQRSALQLSEAGDFVDKKSSVRLWVALCVVGFVVSALAVAVIWLLRWAKA